MIVFDGTYVIDARREKALGGHDNIYYSVTRQDDGLIALDGFYDGGITVREAIADLRAEIDAEHRNAEAEGREPWSDDGSGWV